MYIVAEIYNTNTIKFHVNTSYLISCELNFMQGNNKER